jgi:hypothetical protein
MAREGPFNLKAARRGAKSEVLTTRQAVWILVIGALMICSMAVLYWRGFPVGETFAPTSVGLIFILGMCYTIKTGVFYWKGGGRTYRNQEPIAFWLWVSVFMIVGLLSVAIGIVGFFKH